jgi:hypothetical protein
VRRQQGKLGCIIKRSKRSTGFLFASGIYVPSWYFTKR